MNPLYTEIVFTYFPHSFNDSYAELSIKHKYKLFRGNCFEYKVSQLKKRAANRDVQCNYFTACYLPSGMKTDLQYRLSSLHHNVLARCRCVVFLCYVHQKEESQDAALICFSPFLTFRHRLLVRGIAGHGDIFPSFPVSGPFLPYIPGFQVPPDSNISTSTSVFL